VEDFPADARSELREARTGGFANTFVSLLGAVGAFTFFNFNGGAFLTRSRSADEREELERDRLHAK
jgi:hypothetical protein